MVAVTRQLPGLSIIDDFNIRTEPRGLFGRFFLRAEQLLADEGLFVRAVGLEELVRINEANSDSWKPIIFNFDHRVFPAGKDDVFACVAYDRDGEALMTAGLRYYDMTGSNVHAEMTSLRVFFGEDAPRYTDEYAFELTAPRAHDMSGIMAFIGAVWVHPRARQSGMTRLMSKCTRYHAMSQRHFDSDFGFARKELAEPQVRSSYGIEDVQPGFALKQRGETLYSGMFGWVSHAHAMRTLEADVAAWEAASSTDDIRRYEQHPVAAPAKR